MTPPASAAAAAPGVHRGRSAAPARPAVAPRGPRRISGPARPAVRPGRARPPAQAPGRGVESERGLLLGVLAAMGSLSRNPSLDRLIRGRTWIVVIAFALIGIVTLQLLVLRLNANIGRALVREAQLQRANAALSIEGSELAAGERVESLTAKLGMELVPEGALRFLAIDPRANIARAAAALNKPVQTTSTSSTEGAGDGTSAAATGAGGEASAATSTASEANAGASTASANAATGQSGETDAPASEAGVPATSESPAAGTPSPGPTQSTSAEVTPTGVAGGTGATEAAPGTGSSGAQAGGSG
jgi:hypothetical protein